MRSWSSLPPPYQPGNEHPDPQTSPRRQGTRPSTALSQWLLTFDKQWLLVHTCATLSCVALMFTAAAVFVTPDFGNFNESHPSWLASAWGMMSLMISGISFRALLRLYVPNPSQTVEQQNTYKFIGTVCATVGQIFAAAIHWVVGSIVISAGLKSKDSQPSSRMRLIRAVAITAAVLCFLAAMYDVARLYKDGTNRHADEYSPEDDLLEDLEEYDGSNVRSVQLP